MGIGFCVLRYHTRDRGYDLLGTLGSASCNLAYESAGVRFVTVILFCILRYHARDRRDDLLRPLGPASWDIAHETRGTNCFGHWILRLVISHTKQGGRVVMGIGLCIWRYHTGDRGYHSLRA